MRIRHGADTERQRQDRRLALLGARSVCDRVFVRQSLGSSSGSSLVRTIIALARAFNMTTVAEGVEKQEQLDLLWHLGCDQSQGFLHSAALPVHEFTEVLQRGKGVLLQPADLEPASDRHAHSR